MSKIDENVNNWWNYKKMITVSIIDKNVKNVENWWKCQKLVKISLSYKKNGQDGLFKIDKNDKSVKKVAKNVTNIKNSKHVKNIGTRGSSQERRRNVSPGVPIHLHCPDPPLLTVMYCFRFVEWFMLSVDRI